ncbi:MAG: FAD-binding oxidoreductase [Steroidobacteraceae bacterium]
MKRRTFVTSVVAAAGATALPFRGLTTDAPATSVPAMTGDGRRILLARSDVEELRSGLRGPLLLADSTGYDSARKVWNGMIDRRPALIGRCAGAADVIRCVNFARAHDLLVAVRGGGHSLSGQSVCDDGLMIDLSLMRSVRVDPGRRLARAEGGALLGDLDRESLAFGLVTPAGTVSHTGVAGLTLGGGFGRLARKFGLTSDNVTAFDIVTADGRLLHASDADNADLNWGLRGGGGNFGVVTSFEYRLHPFDPIVYGGHLVFPAAQARSVLENYAANFPQAADDLWIEPVLASPSPTERCMILDICYCGPAAAAERALAPFRRGGKPLRDTLSRVPYQHLQTQDDERARHGRRTYTKSGFVPGLEDPLIEVILDAFTSAPIARPRIALSPKGGAIARFANDTTAFWHRSSLLTVLMNSSDEVATTDRENREWVRSNWKRVEPFTYGVYSNFAAGEQSEQVPQLMYGDNHGRLLALKNKYDPTNLFRLNANIRPSGRAA